MNIRIYNNLCKVTLYIYTNRLHILVDLCKLLRRSTLKFSYFIQCLMNSLKLCNIYRIHCFLISVYYERIKNYQKLLKRLFYDSMLKTFKYPVNRNFFYVQFLFLYIWILRILVIFVFYFDNFYFK